MTQLLPRSSAADEGVSAGRLAEFLDAAGRFGGIDSVIVVRHGRVIAEQWWPPADAVTPHVMWSISKSFTSMAVGLAIEDGLLTLDDAIVTLLPDAAPAEPDARLAAMTVRHLLTMTSGHAEESLPDDARLPHTDWARWILNQPVPYEPGTHFVYNSGATYLLSAIIQRLTGHGLLDYLRPRLFEPLGIRDATWLSSPQGIDVGGWGLSVTTEDLATFGQLLLRHGEWNGAQLVPAAWVDAATAWQVPNASEPEPKDWGQGYGYQFWQCRHGAYRADGLGGQLCVVLPDADVVVAVTAWLTDMQSELDLVWDYLLPALGTVAE